MNPLESAHLEPSEAVRRAMRGYTEDDSIDPAHYGALLAVYGSLVGALGLVFRATGRRLPRRVGAGDVALLGVATFKLSRLLSRDKVTSFFRAPFTRYKGDAPESEVNEAPRGSGLRRAVGELASCPFCMAQWTGTALTALYLFDPPAGRAASVLFTSVAIADGLQYAETALHRTQQH